MNCKEESELTINSESKVKEDIRAIVAEIVEQEPADIEDGAHFVKDLGMDSMMALEILASLEKKFKIVIPEESLPKFTSLNETTNIVESILGKK